MPVTTLRLVSKPQAFGCISRTGNPYDNAKAESFFKSVKTEEVYVNDYRPLTEARAHLGHFLEAVYNQKRLHSPLGYVLPVEFEEQSAQTHHHQIPHS